MPTDWRAVTGLAVPADSPLGRGGRHVETVTGHLPPPAGRGLCALCRTPWPCGPWDRAARALEEEHLPVGYLLPLDLHAVLWPPGVAPAAPERPDGPA
ncbi:hypothetical protein ABZ816_33370 [Actinosynnema sp. NPDC047251]|uniref:Uncharacterized protein n=1 Tax=Saccharothrix espanaensis (strain ATCC 51144 / DSM 44229 / JCM 9112 / NBRC 15066 / NRRL 15764) TaxID=1179773 RepID=K0K842_SACES|nr:hypothetical protein [Saccharothrix espanaensis]CCH33004.1 hypothetical protein BN6_57460 [Saccharothrix espanaensis DSM 44229]